MTMNVGRQIAELKRMTVTQLRQKHLDAFGEPTRSGHEDHLVKRIAWRLQAQEADIAIRLPSPSQHSEHSPMPQKTQASDGGDYVRRVTLLSNSG